MYTHLTFVESQQSDSGYLQTPLFGAISVCSTPINPLGSLASLPSVLSCVFSKQPNNDVETSKKYLLL